MAARGKDPRDWSPGYSAPVQLEAEKAVKESVSTGDFYYRGEKDLGRTWAMTFSRNRDSGLLEQSNYDVIKEDLEKKFPKDVSDERFTHFAVGWIDQLLVRMLDKNGKVTKAGIAALEWKDRLERYPVASDEDYSRRQLEAALDNIASEGSLDETTAQAVYDWLEENNERALQDEDGKGGYPSREEINTALKALGVLGADEGEPSPVYVDPPEQLKFWPTRPE
jgi:hypothetical protein